MRASLPISISAPSDPGSKTTSSSVPPSSRQPKRSIHGHPGRSRAVLAGRGRGYFRVTWRNSVVSREPRRRVGREVDPLLAVVEARPEGHDAIDQGPTVQLEDVFVLLERAGVKLDEVLIVGDEHFGRPLEGALERFVNSGDEHLGVEYPPRAGPDAVLREQADHLLGTSERSPSTLVEDGRERSMERHGCPPSLVTSAKPVQRDCCALGDGPAGEARMRRPRTRVPISSDHSQPERMGGFR